MMMRVEDVADRIDVWDQHWADGQRRLTAEEALDLAKFIVNGSKKD